MNPADIVLLALIPATLVVSAVCSASETALFLLAHNDRMRLRRQHPAAFRAVAALLARPRRLLVTILVFNTIANTTFFVATALLGRRFEKGALAILIAVIAPAVLLVAGEVLPKTLASIHRVRFSRVIAAPLLGMSRLAAPLMSVIDRGVVAPLTRLVRPRGDDQPDPIDPEELSTLVQLGAGQGVLDADEEHLLAEVVELGRLRVRDVMTPRVDIRWLDASAGRDEVIAAVARYGHAKLPVFESSPDEPSLGWLNARRYLAACEAAGRSLPFREHLEPVRYVPEQIRLDQLLEHFRSTHSHMALAVDEHGGVTGLVEVADAVKELIGSTDGGDGSDADQLRMVGPGEWIVPGRLSVREWSDFFERNSGYEASIDARVRTVAGLILSRLGRVPHVGEAVTLGNVRLQVESMRGRTIEVVRVALADGDRPAAEARA